MKRTLRSVVVAALLIGGTLVVPASASADDAPEVLIEETFTASELDAAMEAAEVREEIGADTEEDRNLEDQLVDLSEAQGSPLTDEDISVLHLDDDVQAAVPENINLTEVEVIADGDNVSVAVEAEESEDTPTIAAAGPGMGSWGQRADGQYVLTVRNPNFGTSEIIGTGTFLWAREKYLNDGNGTYDWWTYTRKGIGQATNVSGDNWQIPKLRVQSYPYDSIESGLVNWTGLEPSSDFTGQCGGHTFSTGISTPVFNAGYSFQDCDSYKVWHNPNNPGSYHITMDQGSWVAEGSRSAGYTVGWKSKQGTAGSMHDFQRILFQRGPTTASDVTTCDSYNASKTCEGW